MCDTECEHQLRSQVRSSLLSFSHLHNPDISPQEPAQCLQAVVAGPGHDPGLYRRLADGAHTDRQEAGQAEETLEEGQVHHRDGDGVRGEPGETETLRCHSL